MATGYGGWPAGLQKRIRTQCQTPTSTLRLKDEECRVKSGGCKIVSEEQRVKD